MQLHHTETVSTPKDHVWAAFMDLHRVGSCFPGGQVTHVDGDDFVGQVKVKAGPLKLTFHGEGTLEVKDEAAGHARIRSHGTQRFGVGKAQITIDLWLREDDSQRTVMELTTELVLKGLPTRIGASLAQAVSRPLVGRFLRCMGSGV